VLSVKDRKVYVANTEMKVVISSTGANGDVLTCSGQRLESRQRRGVSSGANTRRPGRPRVDRDSTYLIQRAW